MVYLQCWHGCSRLGARSVYTIQPCTMSLHDGKSAQTERRQNRSSSLPFSSSLKPSTVPLPDSINFGSHNIPFSNSAGNLGFILDSKLSMKKHIIKICQTAYFELKRISSIRRFLTEDATKTLVTSYILSRLDYCNCLLMGTPNSVIQPVQKIQNFAARLVLLAPTPSPPRNTSPGKTAPASHFRTY